MPTITEQINGIIDRRLGRGKWENNGRLQQIENAESRILKIRSQVLDLKDLLQLIQYQQDNHHGEYFIMLQKDPSIGDKLKHISTREVESLIEKLSNELILLKKRFSRETVQIAMIGRERMGKSTLIQSITGLGNEVIPAFDGRSCTGTVSVIHNSDGPFRADITFFERSEFIQNINNKLREFFPEDALLLSSLEDIPKLLHVVENKKLNADAEIFIENFVRRFNDYKNLIGHVEISLYDAGEVAQYVAQYQLFNSPEDCPSGYEVVINKPDDKGMVKYAALYYKYLAVKSVNIFTPFSYKDSGKLVLVDTIGIGQPANNDKLLDEMYRVIREESDSAIDVFRPDSMGATLGDNQLEILKGIKSRFEERHPDKWFTYVINEVPKGKGFNADKTQELLNDAKKRQSSDDISFAWAKVINCASPKDVIENLVIPQLNLITANIDDIDSGMMLKAQEIFMSLYREYSILCANVGAVLSTSIKLSQSTLHLFDELYKNLGLAKAMNELDNLKFKEQEEPCNEIGQRLSEITDDVIFDALPERQSIIEAVQNGISSGKVFLDEIDNFRNKISEIYENVNVENLIPLQESVKMELISIFFNAGLLKKIPLAAYDVADGPSTEWLETLLKETVNEEVYPQVYKSFRLILDYQVSIEGLIEYNVAKCLKMINPKYEEFYLKPFVPLPATRDVEDQSDHIFNEIYNRIPDVQEQIRGWLYDFSKIPSHSFYARVDKVWDKLFHSAEGQRQLRYYYLDNCSTIWREEINGQSRVETALGDFNEIASRMSAMLDKRNFII